MKLQIPHLTKYLLLDTDGKIIDTIPISDCEFFRGGLSDNLYIETTDRKLKVFAKKSNRNRQI